MRAARGLRGLGTSTPGRTPAASQTARQRALCGLGAHQAAHEAKGDGVVHCAGKACLPRQHLLLRPAGEALDGGPQVPGSRREAGAGGAAGRE